ncbi:cytochrome c [Duganella sp. HSC-15S17]|uniref:Cytochrome c n=1 Tax=Duganella violaceipulchra TaxID=2849652 RepID=A0ABT1GSL4_9BURK|nr:cytochrome c [Duganella violaceicalia]
MGAGMARMFAAAAFAKHNKPLGHDQLICAAPPFSFEI